MSCSRFHVKTIFQQSFFIDKFEYKNVYQIPRVCLIQLQVDNRLHCWTKFGLSKLLALFLVLTGQRPQLHIQRRLVRTLLKTRITGFILTLPLRSLFLEWIIQRQLALQIRPRFVPQGNGFSLQLKQQVQDDDVLFQVLQIPEQLTYSLGMRVYSCTFAQTRSLGNFLKIPLNSHLYDVKS